MWRLERRKCEGGASVLAEERGALGEWGSPVTHVSGASARSLAGLSKASIVRTISSLSLLAVPSTHPYTDKEPNLCGHLSSTASSETLTPHCQSRTPAPASRALHIDSDISFLDYLASSRK